MVRPPSPPANKPPCAAFQSQPSDLELINSYLHPWVTKGLKAGAFIHEADVYAADPADLTRQFAPAVAQDGERAWYFYTPLRQKTGHGKRKARTVATGDGCWHSEAKSRAVFSVFGGLRQIGHRQSFSFMKKENGVRVRTGWLMMELRLLKEDANEKGSPGTLVLCKVYRSPRNPEPSDAEPATPPSPAGPEGKAADHDGSSDASQAAAASGRQKGDDESSAATAAAAGRKEKAADDEECAETSAASPGRKRKATDDAAAPALKRIGGAPVAQAIKLLCPHCGTHIAAAEAIVTPANSKPESKSEAEIVKGESAPGASGAHQGGETRGSPEKSVKFHQFL